MHTISVQKNWDVIIIGGGIIGLSTAWALARQGLQVALFEKGTVGAEQSSRNWGWIRSLRRDLAELPMALRVNETWSKLQEQVNVGYRKTGLAYFASSEQEMASHEKWLAAARQIGVKGELLGRAAAEDLVGGTKQPLAGALYSAEDGVAEPQMVPGIVAKLAAFAGVKIVENCAVRGLDVAGGKVVGVWTEQGRFGAAAVVCAGGIWSRLFCGNFGINLPQLKVAATAFETTPIGNGPQVALNGGEYTCRPHCSGGYVISKLNASIVEIVPDSFKLFWKFFPAWRAESKLLKLRFGKKFFEELAVPTKFSMEQVSPFEKNRVYDAIPTERTISQAMDSVRLAFPQFAQTKIARQWGGLIDVTPDALPIISGVGSTPGLFIATGFSGHGFGIGFAAGDMMAGIIFDKSNRNRREEDAFSFDRFDLG